MFLYVPQGADATTPIFFWTHGGSNWMGSVSMSGLDGYALAAKGQIVVFPQYRLGFLGLLPPAIHPASSDPNFATRDLAFALKTIKENIGTQGNGGAITISGHSSGAAMLRSLWQVPNAGDLFQRVIVHSDCNPFPHSSMQQHKKVRDKGYSFNLLKDVKSLEDLKKVDIKVFQKAIDFIMEWDGAVKEPTNILNPVWGTPTIPYDPTAALHGGGVLTIQPRNVPLLMSTTKDDGGYVVSSNYGKPVSIEVDEQGSSEYMRALENRCANDATSKLFFTEEKYDLKNYPTEDVARHALTDIITDGVYRCAGRDTASEWTRAGGEAYVVEINDSAPFLYSLAVGNDWCIGKVCHGVS